MLRLQKSSRCKRILECHGRIVRLGRYCPWRWGKEGTADTVVEDSLDHCQARALRRPQYSAAGSAIAGQSSPSPARPIDLILL